MFLITDSLLFSTFIRMDSWQDILSEEIEKRDANWNPIKDKTYSEISVENRVRKNAVISA